MKNRIFQKAKKALAAVLTIAMTVTVFPVQSAKAEDGKEMYPYTLFAASAQDGAITVTGNACVNGNIATNGTVVFAGNSVNANGAITENANERSNDCSAKLDELYFAGENVVTILGAYVAEEVNCNLSAPMVVQETMEVKGNVNLNTSVKVSGNITFAADSLNANNAVLYSENGDITISGNNVNFTGLLYAPAGEVKIQAQHINLNSIIVIADTITLEAGNANINYNRNMAEIVGVNSGEDTTEPESEDTVLLLLGKYNAEAHSIDMEWYTNATEADVTVWTSEDNVTYEQAATVTDVTTYQYVITEEFETKYFKASVKKESEEVSETVPFVVVKNENGYSVSLLDSDKDGVADEYELLAGTDVNNPDTDGDTLTDYEELYITQTDATKYDSVTEGLSDAEADSDGDKLSNREESEYATDVQNRDTDSDALTDYEELKVYTTDPLKADTDGDTLKDGDELALGLDPLNPLTFGVPDAEYTVEQTISADSEVLEEINTDENEYRLSVDVTASGYVEGNLTAKETGYAASIQNEFMVGIASELSYTKADGIESVTLTFELDDEVIGDSIGLFPEVEELSGIKRFNVFKYFEELNMLLPIETVVDEENNRIYATTDELGTYCVMDMERWLASFEVPEEVYLETPMMFSVRPEVSENETAEERIIIDCVGTPKDMEAADVISETEELVAEEVLADVPMMFAAKKAVDKTPLDVVFLLQTSGQLENTFLSQKTMIYELMVDLTAEYGRGNVRFAVITYNLSGAEFLPSTEGENWFTTAYGLRQALNDLTYEYTTSYTDRGNAFQKLQNEVQFKENASKFIFQVMNGSTTVGNTYFDQINTCAKLEINYSEIGPKGYYYSNASYAQQVADAIASTNGISVTFGSETQYKVFMHIYNNAVPPQLEFDAIVPTGWKHIVLDGILDPNNGVNSDTDELTDWEEIDTDRISWTTDGEVILPTIQECIGFVEKPYAEEGLTRYKMLKGEHIPTVNVEAYLNYVLNSTYILPIYSDPTLTDTDGDNLLDDEEYYLGTHPLNTDSDNDQLSDYLEVDLWFDPLKSNPDGDYYSDYIEWVNGTNPFVYDMTPDESKIEFLKGGLLGDFETADNIEMLCGQVVFSLIPFAADARDFVANAFFNGDGWATLLNVLGFGLDFTGAGGMAGEGAKAVPKLGKFVVRYADDTPKVVEAIVRGAKHFPKGEQVIPELVKILPTKTFDEIAQSVSSGKRITKADYKELQGIYKAAEKSLDVGNSLKPQKLLDELINSGNKFNIDEVVAITKMPDGKLVWLEIGKEIGERGSAGLLHIERHLSQFISKGISKEEIPEFIMTALSKGKKVGTQNTRDIYEVVYKGKLQRVAIQVSDNGFIVGANPKSVP